MHKMEVLDGGHIALVEEGHGPAPQYLKHFSDLPLAEKRFAVGTHPGDQRTDDQLLREFSGYNRDHQRLVLTLYEREYEELSVLEMLLGAALTVVYLQSLYAEITNFRSGGMCCGSQWATVPHLGFPLFAYFAQCISLHFFAVLYSSARR